jgi:hypothetical protein
MMGFVIIMSTSCETPGIEMATYRQKHSSKITITKYFEVSPVIKDEGNKQE